jgi:FKBP-type peptidyl-prolyl cis-trans isomerase FkpA
MRHSSLRLSEVLPRVALAALLAGVLAGCNNNVTAPSSSLAFTSIDVTVGTGATAVTGSTATIQYTTWLYSSAEPGHKGVQVDTDVGATPLQFVVGAGEVIVGLDVGVKGMNVGGERVLYVPANFAFGSMGSGLVPANAALVFDVTLLAVQ